MNPNPNSGSTVISDLNEDLSIFFGTPFRARMTIMVLGLAVMTVLLLYPPWKFNFELQQRKKEIPGPYAFVGSPPPIPVTGSGSNEPRFMDLPVSYWRVTIDFQRLLLPVAAVAIVTIGLVWVLPAREKVKPSSDR